MSDALRRAKRLVVGVIGFTILLIGILMIILPGPAFILIPVGLAILATQFAWARRLLKKVKRKIK
ncbi:MAG: PGPGW domain-containing protein [Nitrospirota bacterium]|nr:PGPGW domain-containing protein [Nitrospirota bacterium]MDH5768154.1 PGPGW domain-containing protein [Nitrospirota bacterium]